MLKIVIFTITTICFSLKAYATDIDNCFRSAGDIYNISPRLLKAIATIESGLSPHAINRSNSNGTEDYGIMQINSKHLTNLRKYGITKNILLQDACSNIHVGAWILASNFYQLGSSWAAVGAYNAGTRQSEVHQELRRKYVIKVKTALKEIAQL